MTSSLTAGIGIAITGDSSYKVSNTVIEGNIFVGGTAHIDADAYAEYSLIQHNTAFCADADYFIDHANVTSLLYSFIIWNTVCAQDNANEPQILLVNDAVLAHLIVENTLLDAGTEPITRDVNDAACTRNYGLGAAHAADTTYIILVASGA